MTEPGDTAANASTAKEIKAGLVRLLRGRIREISDDPRQMREVVYELARIKLLEQFTHADAREARELQQVLERAIRDVERSFERSDTSSSAKAAAAAVADSSPLSMSVPPPVPTPAASVSPAVSTAETPRRPAPPSRSRQGERSGAFKSLVRLTVILLLIASAGTAFVYWPRLKIQLSALSQVAPLSERASDSPNPQPGTVPAAPAGENLERAPESPKEPMLPAAHPSMPLPTTFGVYALNEGQLHELKQVPGKVPDRRVTISAAINTPSATTVMSGDVKFIVFRPDGGVDASGTEVRVVAKVSRSMGVDASGKAAMVSAGDSWVIRSMSYPYKVGPIEDQSRMLLLQPEQDGFALAPGRYIVVVKGMGYDFTVAGTITDPNQCVERINAANGAFYSPCPPPRR